jgi:hypothetical protein
LFHFYQGGICSALVINQKELVEELKGEWKKLWREKHNDKLRAEGVAVNDYSKLFVDKGTIIHASRDFKQLNFRDILEQHEIAEKYVPVNPHVGGWTKFVKESITKKQVSSKKRDELFFDEKKVKPQPKKGGRGWLHA